MNPIMATRTRRHSFTPDELDGELGRVHEREFARLLLRAAALCARKTGCSERELEGWRRAARRARELARLDGYEPPGLLRHALGSAPGNCRAGVEELVRAACACSSAEVQRWRLRRAGLPHALAHSLAGSTPAEVAPW